MKQLVMMILSFALVGATPVLITAQMAKEPKVYCCHGKGHSHGKGKCDKLHTKSECEKEGGLVVSDCKECK